MSATALDLCRDLIRCVSVTPTDGGAIPFLAAKLQDAGFTTDLVTFAEPGQPDVLNLHARIGTAAPHLVFAGHTDVVPPGDTTRWRFPPFSGEIADGQVWGRGASDMKGAVAAFAAAAIAHVEAHGPPAGSIGFLITGDEEGPAVNGTGKLLRWAQARGERFDHCIVGEPTNPDAMGDMIKIGRRGSQNGTLTVTGRQGHAAYPHRADNPIPHLVRLIQGLIGTPLDEGTDHFDASTFEMVSVDTGNPAWNVIPGETRARFNIRFNDLWTPDNLRAELERRCAAVAGSAHYALTFEPCNAVAFITIPDAFTDLVSSAVELHTGRKPALSTSGGTSDARFIRAYCPVLEFGLVGQTMHMVDERAAVDDIVALTAIYGDILRRYFEAFA